MVTLLLALIYLAFISLGLPGSLLGSAWPQMAFGFRGAAVNGGNYFNVNFLWNGYFKFIF